MQDELGKLSKIIQEKPDIIIENGKYDKEKNEYRFINGDYVYIIAEKEEGTEIRGKRRAIKQNSNCQALSTLSSLFCLRGK